MKIQEVQPIVESILNEYFDDATQKKSHDYIDFKNPYSDDIQKFAKVDHHAKKRLASLPNNSDTIDVHKLFFDKIYKPLEDKMPEVFKNATFNDDQSDRVVITNYLKIRNLKIEIKLSFYFPNAQTVRIVYDYETYYDHNKITPEQENMLQNDDEVVGVRSIGDYVTFKFKPLERLNSVLKYEGSSDNLHKIFNWMAIFLYSIQNIAQKIAKTNLP